MNPESHSGLVDGPQFFPQRTMSRLLLLGLVFFSAFVARLGNFDAPLVDFHPTRQYRYAFVARNCFLDGVESVPTWKKQIAVLNQQSEGIMEPPVTALLACLGYRIVGGEHFWIARLLSVVFWLIGGVFLYLLARELVSPDAAIFAAAFYLFLPYGITASRSFQPDPLMVMALVISLWAIARFHRQPSTGRLLLAAVISALAIMIKPVCLFVIFAGFVLPAVFQRARWSSLVSPKLLVFSVVALLPSFAYYVYGMLSVPVIQYQASTSFLPHFLIVPSYWKGWINLIGRVIGYIPFVGAILGALLFSRGFPQAFVLSLWAGYCILGLVFTNHIHTHDYYHLQLIPIVALSVGPVLALITARLAECCARGPWRLAAWGVLGFAVVLSMREGQPRLDSLRSSTVAASKEIGSLVNHTTKAAFIAHEWGKILKYHGELSGVAWPTSSDLWWAQNIHKLPPSSAEERLNSLMAEHALEYFIVTDFKEFESQKDIKQFLTANFPTVNENSNYLIFDLKKRINAQNPKYDLKSPAPGNP